MAQNSAHVTQTFQAKPSIFELVAADSLQSSFHPAIKRIVHFLTNLNPTKFGWMWTYYDEFYLCLNAAIQQHYIRTYGGSLSEIFYSLTRNRIANDSLGPKDKFVSFACIVLLPYMHAKLTTLLQKWTDDIDQGTLPIESTRRKKRLINLYNSVKGVYDLAQMMLFIRYLADLSKSHTILNKVIDVKLEYLPMDTNVAWSWSELFTGKLRSSAIFTGAIFRALELSAFFLQFIQWWQNETTHRNLTNLPVPEAPSPHPIASRYKGICPICLQKWKIPTVNRISGYVFCYKCIVKHLDHKGCCPVTNHASSIDDLVRIYDL